MTKCRDFKTYDNRVFGLGAGNLTKCIGYVQRSRQAISPGRSSGEKRKVSLQLRLWNLNSSSNSSVVTRRMSCQISANQREAETSEKHVPWVMTSLLTSSPPISISHRLFLCRYSNSSDVVASSPSFSGPQRQSAPPGELVVRLRTAGLEWGFNNSKRLSPEVRKD